MSAKAASLWSLLPPLQLAKLMNPERSQLDPNSQGFMGIEHPFKPCEILGDYRRYQAGSIWETTVRVSMLAPQNPPKVVTVTAYPICNPWCWNMNPNICPCPKSHSSEGKYTSTMVRINGYISS